MILKKRHITLIEIMIVMFLIALITGVIAYNYSGSLDEGKAFKTKAGIEKLETILSLAQAEKPDMDIDAGWKQIVKSSPLVKDAEALIRDGWGEEYQIEMAEGGKITVTSKKLDEYNQRKRS